MSHEEAHAGDGYTASGNSPPHCPTCSTLLSPARLRYHSIYCSQRCQMSAESRRVSFERAAPAISTSSTGALSELLACAEMLRRGYHVFRSVSPSCPCDLILMRDGQLIRAEVKSGNIYKPSGKIGYAKPRNNTYDMLIVVLPDGTLLVDPE
jgi:PD-(D/E)XK nuclease superfamily protein